MKNIKEKELLINFARSMGQEVDADLIEEVEVYNIIKSDVHKSIKENIFKDLAKALKDDNAKPKVEPIQYPLPPSLDDLLTVLNEGIEKENNNELVQEKTETERASENPTPSFESDNRKIIEGNEAPSNPTRDSGPQPGTQTLADLAAKFISEAPKDSFQQPDPLIVSDNLDAIRGKLKFLEQWVSKISSAGAGSGEVNFRWLDDVDRASIGNSEPVLRYNPVSKKFFFGTLVGDQGPIRSMTYDTRGYANITPTAGTTSWNSEKDCLDIYQADGSILQTGLENYVLVWNNSANTLPNGMFVSLNTITSSYNEIPACQPYLANAGSFPYFTLGLLTNDVAANTVGRATVLGEVHELNTTGNLYGETWALGDVLWANPAIPGGLTNIRPTAPNVVVTVGKVVTRDAIDGMILVRPVVLPHFYYGTFISTVTQQAANVNYPNAIKYDFTGAAGPVAGQSGFHLASNSRIVSEVTGLFNYQFSLQVSSGNASAKNIYIWPRINGVDVPNSATRLTFNSTGDSVAAWNFVLSMIPGRYFELMFAVDDTSLYLRQPSGYFILPGNSFNDFNSNAG
jgi:hypothetical protein